MKNMPIISIIYSSILIVVGLLSYFVWGSQASMTALIPSFFGIAILVASVIALHERYLKHAMHVAVLISVLLFLGSSRGLMGLMKIMQGEEVARPLAVKVQAFSAILSLIFIAVSVVSFIQARRARLSQS